MLAAAAGAAAAPLDVLLAGVEAQRVRASGEANHSLILVCGAPRSGTTLVYQTLVQHLPVAFFPNLTSLFPRSPLTSLKLFQRFLPARAPTYRSFYGRTPGLAGSNDALYLWDRWLGADRAVAPSSLSETNIAEMRSFFLSCDRLFDRPLANKNNSLNASAHLVAEALPQATFICVTRKPNALARSLYQARLDIHGSPHAAYGVSVRSDARRHGGIDGSVLHPVQSVCEQALYYERLARMQQSRIGERRFWTVGYEDFCRAPGELVERVAAELLNETAVVQGRVPASFAASRSSRIDPRVGALIDERLAELA
jgi:hypothetical protein